MNSKWLNILNATATFLIILSLSLSSANAETLVGPRLSSFINHTSVTNLQSENLAELVSVSDGGTQGNEESESAPLSADGRFVVFTSPATNLVPAANNGAWQVYVRDKQAGLTELITVTSDGNQGNGESSPGSISVYGRYVVYCSSSTNLVPNGDGVWDTYVYDRQNKQTELVSAASDGTPGNAYSCSPAGSISDDGRYVAFFSMSNNLIPDDSNESSDVFIHDRLTKQTELISKDNDGDQGNSDSYGGSISADGRFVVFYSWSSNLVPEDEKGFSNVFVHDRQTEQTELISITSEGKPGNSDSEASGGSISGNGRYVAFKSFANNLVGGDTNGFSDIFVRDRELGDTVRVSVSTNGEQGNGENGWFNSVSSNGRYVVYSSSSSTLVDEDNNELEDIFVHDLQSGKTERVTMGSDGTEPNGYSYAPFISADGKYITYTSLADNLVMGDENEYRDVFINEWIGVMEIFIPIVTK